MIGAFSIGLSFDTKEFLFIIASDGDGWRECGLEGEPWEHVSVSVKRLGERGQVLEARRTPTWEEMVRVKNYFWRPDELVLQFHPPEDEYINHHPYTLHLWKPTSVNIPLPPKETIGPRARSLR